MDNTSPDVPHSMLSFVTLSPSDPVREDESTSDNDQEKREKAAPPDSASLRSLQRDHTDQFAQLVRASSEIVHGVNPFLDLGQSSLDPGSPQFDFKLWAKTFFEAVSNDPERYPQRSAGVSYRNLNVYGRYTPIHYQSDVVNVVLDIPKIIVSAINKRGKDIQILKDFEGLVKSGEMLMVLGQPGSGVSTFLKTVAGQTRGLCLDPRSEISYQGIPWDVMHGRFRGEIIYQAETDVHFPHLTVGQTLSFAAAARTPRNRLPGVSRKRHAEIIRDVVMAVFGISHTINTRVGDDFVRGVSGGERKRVSLAEVALNQSQIQCWDNSTRGLDSATALQFIKTLRLSTEVAGTTTLVAIYQASQAVYDVSAFQERLCQHGWDQMKFDRYIKQVFDKVVLLYEGRQIYFGRTDHARRYFVDLGFHCPERQTTADFLTSLTNPAERVVRPGFENLVPRTPIEFAQTWQKSSAREELLQAIVAFEREYPKAGSSLERFEKSRKAQQAALVFDNSVISPCPRTLTLTKSLRPSTSPYTISVPMQIKLCTVRGFQRLMGNKSFFLITVLGNFAISLVLGSVFYNLPFSAASISSRGTLLYFAILFNALNSALEIFSLYEQRPIVEKQKRYALYHPISEAIASVITEMPSKLISTFAFNVPLYFMSNLRREAGAFFIFLLFGFTCTLAMSMIFRTIGQSTRTVYQALTPTAFFVLAMVIYTGYILPTAKMQGWLRWIHWIDPIFYPYESIMINEFIGRQFPCSQYLPSGPGYENSTGLERACSAAGALPGADYVDGGYYIAAAFGYDHSHLWRNFGILIVYIIFFTVTYFLAAGYVSTSQSKGEVLLFRRGRKPKQALNSAQDEESNNGSLSGEINKLQQVQADSAGHQQKIIKLHGSTFHWRDVAYEISIKGKSRKILCDVDGWIKPGTLTALMGATGAGKTTLLDVLAGRVTMGIVNGHMFVDGNPLDQSFQRKTGYVRQQDLHLETSTVRESLRFCAVLRQPPTTSKEDKFAYVEEVIRLLDMGSYADAIVGIPGEGLNIEQRKRLTIAVELAAKPDLLLFLDEPTSGLDSQTAWSIMTLLRKLSNNGQAILCTIHQPSALLFQQFDRLLLLSKGGKTAYFGDLGKDSKSLIGYFEGYGARPCGQDENPAEWMMEVIGAAPGVIAVRDWPDTWRRSPEYSQVRQFLSGLEENHVTTVTDHSRSSLGAAKYAAPFRTQFFYCTERVFEQYWRTPTYIYSKLLLCLATSIFIGASFYNAENSIQGLQDQMFAIFMLMVIFAFLVYQTLPNFVVQRTLYEARERPSKTYAWYIFMFANLVVELAWNTVAAPLIFFPFYYLVGMYENAEASHAVAERGGLMFLLTLCFTLFTATFALMAIAGVATAEIGAILSLVVFAFSLIFCGVMATPAALPGFWIFMYRISPFTYLIGALLSTGLANSEVHCSSLEIATIQPFPGETCAEYMAPYIQVAGGTLYNPQATKDCEFCTIANTNVYLASVSSFYDERWRNFGILWAYIIFNAFAAVFLYWLARVPKRGINGGGFWLILRERVQLSFAQGLGFQRSRT